MSKIDIFLEEFSNFNDKALYPTNLKKAIVGYVERCSQPPILVLDKEKCIKILMSEGMSDEEAIEYFEFNVIGSWAGEDTPCFMTFLK